VIQGNSLARDHGYYSKVQESELVLDSTIWKIVNDSGFGIFPKRLEIENFKLTDGVRALTISDLNNKGIEIGLEDFELRYINPFINYDKLSFSGKANARFRVEDIYMDRQVKGFLEVPDFRINNDPYGSLLLKAQQDGPQVVDVEINIDKDIQKLYVRGYYNNETKRLNADVSIADYPMDFFEYIIEDGISETVGTTSIDAKIYGPLDNLKMSGSALVKNAGVKVDYLGAYYRIDNQRVKIDESFIDFSDVIMVDERDKTARITGGLRHNMLADIRADLSMSSPEFIALNTTDQDNPIYYGLGIGEIDISFKGPFDAMNIRVDATAGPLSRLYIPIGTGSYNYEESFVKFDYERIQRDSASVKDLVSKMQQSGVDFEMSLAFSREAEVQVIYDPTTNNTLIAQGTGNIQVKAKRDGEFSVYGTYDVVSGSYLYTAYGFIAKPFTINSGGKVTWTGDPINATIDVTAQYPRLRATLDEFLREYIATSGEPEGTFQQRQDVDLKLLLTETLFNPNINFDIDFPNLTGPLKTLANSKVRTLKATENGINNQVVGLLVFRNFLPDNNPFANLGGRTVGQTGSNTITEFITNQLSLLASDYLSDKLKDSDFITGIDFELALAQNTGVLGDNSSLFQGLFDVVPDEVQVNLRNKFKNENFVLNVGGNYVRESAFSTASNYVTGDFSLDWYITSDRRLKVRFYGKYDYNEAFYQRVQRYGFGLNYRREFGKISDFKNALDDLIKEINNEAGKLPLGANGK
jgi:hypothetical protein